MKDRYPPACDAQKRETLFRAAETRASQQVRSDTNDVWSFSDKEQPDPQHLASVAIDELHKRKMRSRFLAPDLSADTTWTILLDLFLAGHRLENVALSECGTRWGITDATAARHIAALIEARLVVRLHAGESQRHGCLSLSPQGQETMIRTLAQF